MAPACGRLASKLFARAEAYNTRHRLSIPDWSLVQCTMSSRPLVDSGIHLTCFERVHRSFHATSRTLCAKLCHMKGYQAQAPGMELFGVECVGQGKSMPHMYGPAGASFAHEMATLPGAGCCVLVHAHGYPGVVVSSCASVRAQVENRVYVSNLPWDIAWQDLKDPKSKTFERGFARKAWWKNETWCAGLRVTTKRKSSEANLGRGVLQRIT